MKNSVKIAAVETAPIASSACPRAGSSEAAITVAISTSRNRSGIRRLIAPASVIMRATLSPLSDWRKG